MEIGNRIINRPLYEDKIRPYIGKNLIKVLTGQRRVGKSYILQSLAREISEMYPDSKIITINLEEFSFSHVKDADTLNDEIKSKLTDKGLNFIFIDEIQEVKNFEKVVRSLILDPCNDIYVTGSNSSMLSYEVASRLAGRSIEFKIHPLSYREFRKFHRLDDSERTLNDYMRYGGMPYLKNLPHRENWNEYLCNLTDSIVYRDVVAKNSLRNNDFLHRIMAFLADNIGRLFTAKKISDYLKSQQISNSVSSVQSYVDYIMEAFIINRCKRWDIEGKKLFEIGEKYFFEDIGIRNSIIGYNPHNFPGIMENMVYNQLVINGYDVKTGVNTDGREIDFIAERNGELKYIQVCQTVKDEKTFAREFGNLEKISDNYEKLVITLADEFPNTYKGIKILTLREFLDGEI